ncbi:MAG TPA: tetratricopeptide repeat protein [Pirellulaceae bacterium]|nr:tetratricopeptide repeat protein [Pirellulaceae bacterium]HMO92549.1 tetratricopeptide repeat protein [Pirellulaceae bacterium]HMP68969.1 tetratricopeptide repeat protein [Pirellulaceae bacterium]
MQVRHLSSRTSSSQPSFGSLFSPQGIACATRIRAVATRSGMYCVNLVLLAALCSGCSSNVADNSSTLSEQDGTATATDDNSVEQYSLAETEAKVAELIVQVNRMEAEFKFAEAIEAWKNIYDLVAKYAGEESWQATNARLSLETAQRQAQFSPAELGLLSEFAERQRLASEHLNSGRLEEALNEMQWVMSATERLLGRDSHSVARIKLRMGQLLYQAGQIELAAGYLRDAFVINREKLGVHPETESNAFLLGHALVRTGAIEQGVQCFEYVERLTTELWGEEHLLTATRKNDLGAAYHVAGKLDLASAKLEEALAMRKKLHPENHAAVGETLRNLGVVYLDLQKLDLSSDCLTQALTILGNTSGESHILTLDTRSRLATVKMLTQEYLAAEGQLRQVVHHYEHTVPHAQGLAKACFQLGIALGYQSQYHEAEPLLNRALSIQRTELGQWHPETVETMQALAVLYDRIGQTDKAQSIHQALQRFRQ